MSQTALETVSSQASGSKRQSLSFPIELYGLLPSTLSLVLLAIAELPFLEGPAGSTIQFLLGLFVAFFAGALTQSRVVPVVAASIALYFIEIPFLFALGIPAAAGMLLSLFENIPGSPLRLFGVFTALGGVIVLGSAVGFPQFSFYLPVALSGIALVLLLTRRAALQTLVVFPGHQGTIPSNLLSLPFNQYRIGIYCIYFLLVAAPAWTQSLDFLDYRLAAVLHILAMLLAPPLLMAIFEIPFENFDSIRKALTSLQLTESLEQELLIEIESLKVTAASVQREIAAKAVERDNALASVEAERQRALRELDDRAAELDRKRAADEAFIESQKHASLLFEETLEKDFLSRCQEAEKAQNAEFLRRKEELAAAANAELARIQDEKARTLREINDANAESEERARALEQQMSGLDVTITNRTAALAALEGSKKRTLQHASEEALCSYYERFWALPWDLLLKNLPDLFRLRPTPLPVPADLNRHVLVGRDPNSRSGDPILIHEDVLREHVHILGGTGAHKTSLGIMPIILQLLRKKEKRPIVIVDLKGEPPLFHAVREAALRNDQEFLFFTIEADKPTYRFNPFIGLGRSSKSANEMAQPVLDALGLNHGEGYGRSFFTRGHRRLLLETLRDSATKNKPITSLKDLRSALSSKKKGSSEQKDELLSALEGLFEYPQLFTTPEEEAAGAESIIQFDRVLEQNQVVYFWLPAPTQTSSVREVGKLALYNLFFAAIRRRDAGMAHRNVHLVVDEFQQVVGENLALFLSQARSYGISLLLANQNISQLNTSDFKLWPIVNGNVRASLHFSSNDPDEIEMLSNASGEMRDMLRGYGSSAGEGTANSVAEGQSTATSSGTATGTSRQLSSSNSYGKSSSMGTSESSSEGSSRSHSEGYSTSQSSSHGLSSTIGDSSQTSRATSSGSGSSRQSTIGHSTFGSSGSSGSSVGSGTQSSTS